MANLLDIETQKQNNGTVHHTADDIKNYTTERQLNDTQYIRDIIGNDIDGNLFSFRSVANDMWDQPGYFYFRLFFYFTPADRNSMDGGLLYLPDVFSKDYYQNDNPDVPANTRKDCAFQFLIDNGENERADLIRQFVYSLSNINSKTPWYFTKIGALQGLDEYKDGDWKREKTYKLEIDMLPDSVDQRIGRMLQCYRNACFSYKEKKEIVPLNLRQFDMGIYVMHLPLQDMVYNTKATDVTYRYFELADCEIDVNSSNPTADFTSDEAFQQTYKLTINYNNIREIFQDAFDEDLFINEDKSQVYPNELVNSNKIKRFEFTKKQNELENKIRDKWESVNKHSHPIKGGFFTNAANQLISTATGKVRSFLTRLYLGNIYTISGTKLINDIQGAANGDILGTINAVQEYKRTASQVSLSPKINRSNTKVGKDSVSSIIGANPTLEIKYNPSRKNLGKGEPISYSPTNNDLGSGQQINYNPTNNDLGSGQQINYNPTHNDLGSIHPSTLRNNL